jgi:hypothetical protein
MANDLQQTVQISQFLLGEKRQHAADRLSASPGYLGEQLRSRLTDPAIDDPPVVEAVASRGEAAPFEAIDQLGGGGIGDTQHIGPRADRQGTGLIEREEKPQLTEREVVVGPVGRSFGGQPEQRLSVSLDCFERYGVA